MKKVVKLTEDKLRKMIAEAVNTILNEETEEQKRKRQMEDDWQDLERPMKYYKSSFPGDSKYTQATLGDDFAYSWGGAGKTPGALAMDAQLPYVHPYTTQKGGLYKKADTSKWTEPSMKNRGHEGPNAARNFARNIHFDKDKVSGMTPYPYKGEYGPTGDIYGDTDYANLDDQDYFEDKIKSTDGKWYQDKKDYYKKMKKLSQSLGGKRSKKDDDRSFKRALKAADSRPLHRKGSLNRVGMDENVIRKLVSESIKKVLNEKWYPEEEDDISEYSFGMIAKLSTRSLMQLDEEAIARLEQVNDEYIETESSYVSVMVRNVNASCDEDGDCTLTIECAVSAPDMPINEIEQEVEEILWYWVENITGQSLILGFAWESEDTVFDSRSRNK